MAVGEEERRAQSKGEWPGVRRTFLRGFAGMEVCVGGGARPVDVGLRFGSGPEVRFGAGPGLGGGAMRPEDEDCSMGFRRGGPMLEDVGGAGRELRLDGPRVPPVVLWAEFSAGKEGGGMES